MEQPLDNTTNVLRALKHIAANQEKLLQKTTRLLETQNHVQCVPQTVTKIPVDVKRNVRVAVSSCSTKWDFSQSFRAPANEAVNKELVKNLRALESTSKVDGHLLQKALKAHFLAKRRSEKAKGSGSYDAMKQRERRRHRINEKLRLRKQATDQSNQFTEQMRRKIYSALVPEAMSPEESCYETDDDDSDDLVPASDEEEDQEQQRTTTRRKVIQTRPLSWRSLELKNVLESLDRKTMRKKSERARAMVKPRRVGEEMRKDPPRGTPAWAIHHEPRRQKQ